MEEEILRIIAPLPTWAYVALLFLAVIVIWWDNVWQMYQDFSPKHRAYNAEMKRLELEKLQYEVAWSSGTSLIHRGIPSKALLVIDESVRITAQYRR